MWKTGTMSGWQNGTSFTSPNPYYPKFKRVKELEKFTTNEILDELRRRIEEK